MHVHVGRQRERERDAIALPSGIKMPKKYSRGGAVSQQTPHHYTSFITLWSVFRSSSTGTLPRVAMAGKCGGEIIKRIKEGRI